MNKEIFTHNINAINNVADLIYEDSKTDDRIPPVLIIRAMRTIIDRDCKTKIPTDTIASCAYYVIQMMIEFLIFHPEIDAKWVIERNQCFPPLNKREKDAIQPFIDKVREQNK